MVVDDEAIDFGQVFADVGGHDVEAAADGEDGVEVLERGVEAEGSVAEYAVVGGELLFLHNEMDEVELRAVRNHHAFGLACGS